MSIIAYYAHVDEVQLDLVHKQPSVVWNIKNDPRFAKAALLDLDKDYEVLAWLLSSTKRGEQVHLVATYRAAGRQIESKSLGENTDFDALLSEELGKLGVCPGATDGAAADMVLSAIEGRGDKSQRDPKIDFGMGSARLFKPAEVKQLSAALDRITTADLQKFFDRKEMEKFEVGGMEWLSEKDSVLEEFLVPAFQKLRAFYAEAAKSGHYVFVIYQ
ncbi:YfbM family protein [Ideonella azotifigens]|uniref:DUF1877 family protein n=1 Tax=Ideonella azotifigens TaxID=513160 RepID=A0ABN1KBA5_9BURK|nr:DUF1877 family protein [Ideonella azotifigens]MCD2344036.1 YfbM family protein [Ideonella azotifigens]